MGGILPLPEAFDRANYCVDVKRHLHKIHCVFGQYSAWRLRNFTHQEAPWRNHYINEPFAKRFLIKSFAG
jgi:uncharacterized phage-associated protein